MKWLRHPLAQWALGAALGAVFVYASWDKIARPREFARIVYHYQLVGPSQALGYVPANLLAVTLPWLELVTGALLVAGLWRREAAAAAALMLVAFIVAVSWALFHGIDIANCGCFTVGGSAEGRTLGWKLLLGDVGLLAVAALLVATPAAPAAVPAYATTRHPVRTG
ncbi:MAG TPA: MauE/DoxX family redox-associated membrane protein [Vicinamibacteria bacterium]|nr:MauE/DoxX family redox-associated membrane protein [Vicinamibacteria bacterium]